MKLDPATESQLSSLGYLEQNGHRIDRPLLVCDVDEVVLHLVEPFIEVLEDLGFELKSRSFKLTGNVFHRDTGVEATQMEVWQGLEVLFSEQARRQRIVDGAAEALGALSRDIDIVFLTNMPHDFRETRAAHLLEQGLHFPVVTNSGSKVPAISLLRERHLGETGFIDDTPTNLTQVRDAFAEVHLFHFMANADFRALAGNIEGTHISTGDWQEASATIRNVLHREAVEPSESRD